jgi:dTDP-4-dehydrorhamnose reductase
VNLTEKKTLLIGASGQMGAQILNLLGHDRCLVSSRDGSSEAALALDLATIASKADAERALGDHALDAIYCIAGMTNVEGCEDTPELAHFINCRGPEMLAKVASEREIPFVYFSTEYVFDGYAGPYAEEDATNPLSVYGKSKLAGEVAVTAACGHALILRTTVVYGQDFGQKNYVYSLMRVLSAGKEMKVPQDQVSTPTYNRDLAKATIEMVKAGATGIFHVCGPERMDRLEFATTVAEFLGLDRGLLAGMPTSALGQKAPRPLSAGMSIGKLNRLYPEVRMRSLLEGLADSEDELREFLHLQARA